MEATSVSAVTELLVNILLGCFSLMCLSMVINTVQTIINDRREEKRREKKSEQDDEYHQERMKVLK